MPGRSKPKNTTKLLRAAQFASIMLVTLVAGLLWGTWFSISRSISNLSAQAYVELGKTMIHNLALPARILFPLAFVAVLVVIGMLWSRHKSAAFWLACAGAVLLLGALIITVAVEVPIDNQTSLWTVATLPPDWQAIRDRWELHHTIRTFLGLAALGSLVASSLVSHAHIASDRHQ